MARLETPFGFRSTAEEVVRGIDRSGRRMIVTGAASGIGVETARALARTGAEVVLAVRDTRAGERVAGDIAASTGNSRLQVRELDLARRDSVAAFVRAWKGPLHVLVANAGVMALPEQRTPEGWEMQFAINHLGHFALSQGLRPSLAAAGGARIVSVSSSAHQLSPVIFDDLHFAFRPYDPLLAYGQSKTANILFAVEADRRWSGNGIRANALMPGAIATNLQRHLGGMRTPVEKRKTAEEGAATSVLLAVSPLVEGVGARYFVDGCEALPVRARTSDMAGVAPYAVDPVNAERLWEASMRMLD